MPAPTYERLRHGRMGTMKLFLLTTLLLFAALLAACSQTGTATLTPEPQPGRPSPTPPDAAAPAAAPSTPNRVNPRVEDDATYRVNFLLSFDSIRPVYEPVFTSAAETPLKDDELVLALSIDGEAKAYPISVLRGREMVNDELAGTPILVSW